MEAMASPADGVAGSDFFLRGMAGKGSADGEECWFGAIEASHINLSGGAVTLHQEVLCAIIMLLFYWVRHWLGDPSRIFRRHIFM